MTDAADEHRLPWDDPAYARRLRRRYAAERRFRAYGIAAIALAVAAIRQGAAALYGWVRLDGLDAREVPHRPIDRLLAPAAVAAAAVAALFGAHVVRLLAET